MSADAGSVDIPFPSPARLSLRAAGDMRLNGACRTRLYRELAIDPTRVHVVRQVHSRAVEAVVACAGPAVRTPSGEVLVAEADGLVTDMPDVVLAVTVADCMPIWLCDTRTGARGLLHSGWRGTGILARAVEVLIERYGSRPGDLVVVLGPCISSQAYEVDEPRGREFESEWGEETVRRDRGRVFLDMRRANLEICRRCGVDVAVVIDHCTFQDPRLGSYRREGPERYTLMLALLGGPATSIGETTRDD